MAAVAPAIMSIQWRYKAKMWNRDSANHIGLFYLGKKHFSRDIHNKRVHCPELDHQYLHDAGKVRKRIVTFVLDQLR